MRELVHPRVVSARGLVAPRTRERCSLGRRLHRRDPWPGDLRYCDLGEMERKGDKGETTKEKQQKRGDKKETTEKRRQKRGDTQKLQTPQTPR